MGGMIDIKSVAASARKQTAHALRKVCFLGQGSTATSQELAKAGKPDDSMTERMYLNDGCLAAAEVQQLILMEDATYT